MNRRKRFFRAVAAGFVIGAVVIGLVAVSRDHSSDPYAVVLHEAKQVAQSRQPKPVPAKVAAPTNPAGCTDIWTGAADGSLWATPANWSAHRVPQVDDHACLGPGTIVTLTGARERVGSVNDEGSLYVRRRGVLTLVDVSQQSKFRGPGARRHARRRRQRRHRAARLG